jgi:hypothetical protein
LRADDAQHLVSTALELVRHSARLDVEGLAREFLEDRREMRRGDSVHVNDREDPHLGRDPAKLRDRGLVEVER